MVLNGLAELVGREIQLAFEEKRESAAARQTAWLGGSFLSTVSAQILRSILRIPPQIARPTWTASFRSFSPLISFSHHPHRSSPRTLARRRISSQSSQRRHLRHPRPASLQRPLCSLRPRLRPPFPRRLRRAQNAQRIFASGAAKGNDEREYEGGVLERCVEVGRDVEWARSGGREDFGAGDGRRVRVGGRGQGAWDDGGDLAFARRILQCALLGSLSC